MAGNANRGSGKGEYTPEGKRDYYLVKAANEQNELMKARLEQKADYWTKVAKGEVPSQELEALCGPGHKWTAVDYMINAQKNLENSKDPQKIAEFQFKLGYWEKVAKGEEVSEKEQMLFNAYNSQREADRVRSAAEREENLLKRGFNNHINRQANAISLGFALTKGDFPAFGKGIPVGPDGKIRIKPVSVRSCKSGRPYEGINQFVGQVLVAKRGWTPEEDGHFYLATATQCGFITDEKGRRVLNVKPGSGVISISTVGTSTPDVRNSIKGFDTLDAQGQSEAFQKSERVYNLYNSTDIINRNFSCLKDGIEKHRPTWYNKPNKTFDASDAKSSAEYFGKYLLACHYGSPFITTPEKAAEMHQLVKNELEEAVNQGLDGQVYSWFGKVHDVYQADRDFTKAQWELRQKDLAKVNGLDSATVADLANQAGEIETPDEGYGGIG